MKKILFAAAVFVSLTNMGHAKLNVYDSLNQEEKEYAIDQHKPKPYVGLQIGASLQNFRGLKTEKLSSPVNKEYYGAAYTLLAGTDFYNTLDKVPVRIEASLTFRGSKKQALEPIYLDESDTASSDSRSGYLTTGIDSLIATVYVDFHNRSPITPYLTIGAGWSTPFSIRNYTVENSSDSTSSVFADVKEKTNSPVWTAGFGLAWEYDPHFTIDLVARFTETGKTSETVDIIDYSLRTANSIDVMLGGRYIF